MSLPAVKRHLVSSQVYVFILEHGEHLGEEGLQESVGGLEDGVDGAVVAIGLVGVVITRGEEVVLTQPPCERVTCGRNGTLIVMTQLLSTRGDLWAHWKISRGIFRTAISFKIHVNLTVTFFTYNSAKVMAYFHC